MKAKFFAVFYITIGLVLTQASVSAHHATAAQYDTSKTITFKGVISRLDWANPHVRVYVDVKGDRDRLEHWEVELASPGGVIVSGLTKDSLKPETTITIKGYPSKAALSPDSRNDSGDHSATPAEGRRSVCATQITLSNGTTVSFVVGI